VVRVVRPLVTAWSWVEKLTLTLIVLLMSVLVLVTSYQVFSRYVLNHPLRWSEELSRYLLVWIVFLGAWAALKEGRHLGMDILSRKVPLRWRPRLGILVDAVVLAFLIGVLIIAPEILEITSRQRSAVLRVPMSLIYLAFPVGAALMSVEIVLGWVDPKRASPGQVHLEAEPAVPPAPDFGSPKLSLGATEEAGR
jgi:TRAP-type transport system small permease protein